MSYNNKTKLSKALCPWKILKKETRNTQESFSTSSTFYGKSSVGQNNRESEIEREGERERERERAAADSDSIAM